MNPIASSSCAPYVNADAVLQPLVLVNQWIEMPTDVEPLRQPLANQRIQMPTDVEPLRQLDEEQAVVAPMQAQQVEHLSRHEWKRIKKRIKLLGPSFRGIWTLEQYHTLLGLPEDALSSTSPGWWGTGANFWTTMLDLWMQYSFRYQFRGDLQWAMFTAPHPYTRHNATLPATDYERVAYPCVAQIGVDCWVWIACLHQLVFNSRGWWVHVSRIRIVRSSH